MGYLSSIIIVIIDSYPTTPWGISKCHCPNCLLEIRFKPLITYNFHAFASSGLPNQLSAFFPLEAGVCIFSPFGDGPSDTT